MYLQKIKTKYMGTASKKPRAMRSRRSGVKSLNIVKNNLEVLKKLKG